MLCHQQLIPSPFIAIFHSARTAEIFACHYYTDFNRSLTRVSQPALLLLNRVLKTGTLEWYHENVRTRFKRFGSAKVMRSLFKRLSGQPSEDLEGEQPKFLSRGRLKKKWLASRGVLILSAFLLLLFSKFFLPFVSPFREGEKPPTSWLKWLKQLLISVRVQSRLQTVSGQRFLEATACTNFHLFRSFLLPGASGPSQELSPPEPHRTARKLVRAFQKKSSINEAGDPTVWLTHGNNVPALEVTLWNLTSGEPSPLQAATEFEESTWHCFNYG